MKQVTRILLLLAAIAAVALPAAAQEGGEAAADSSAGASDDGSNDGAGGDESGGGEDTSGDAASSDDTGGDGASADGDSQGDASDSSADQNQGGDVLDDSGPDLPTSEYAAEADRMLGEMRNDLKTALDELARARSAKDAVKLNYVNEQITTMKGILRISEDAAIALQEALASGALEKARYEFGKIRMSHRKMKELSAAVQNAKGAEASYTGGTDVTSEVDEAQAGGNEFYGNEDNQFSDSSRQTVDGTDGTDGDGSSGGGGGGDDRPQVTSPSGG